MAPEHPEIDRAEVEGVGESPINEKTNISKDETEDQIEEATDLDAAAEAVRQGHEITPEMRRKVAQHYGHIAEKENLAPQGDVEVILEYIVAMTEEEAIDVLLQAIEYHKVREKAGCRKCLAGVANSAS